MNSLLTPLGELLGVSVALGIVGVIGVYCIGIVTIWYLRNR